MPLMKRESGLRSDTGPLGYSGSSSRDRVRQVDREGQHRVTVRGTVLKPEERSHPSPLCNLAGPGHPLVQA